MSRKPENKRQIRKLKQKIDYILEQKKTDDKIKGGGREG